MAGPDSGADAFGGAGWRAGAAVPTFLKTRFGVDEVVTTLLLNFIVLLFVSMLLEGPLKDPWDSAAAVEEGDRRCAAAQVIQGKRLHAGFIIAIFAAMLIWVFDRRARWLYEMRAVGNNTKAAAFAVIPVNLVLAKTALLSGGLAGLAGWSEVAGLKGNLTLDLSPGFGYTGIVVAMMALLHPLGVVVARSSSPPSSSCRCHEPQRRLPSYIAHVMVALSLLCMVTAIMFTPLPCALDLKMEAIEILFTASLWGRRIRIASPLIFGTLGELICERAGVLNLGIEGIMTAGAFSGWLAVYMGADLWFGVGGGAIVGATLGLLHGVAVVPLGLSQHVTESA